MVGNVLAVVCPGQGSQTPGFLGPWLDVPGVGARLERLSKAAGLDLTLHGTESDADTIRDTAVAQPLIVAAALATFPALFPDDDAAGDPGDGAEGADPTRVGVLAGHSVGEIAAAALAGVLPAESAMALVAERGRAMADAAAATPTGMSAVLGGDADDVAAALERHGLEPANLNGAGQVVAAGTLDALAALAADPPAKARVMPLKVAGAFHTSFMAPAREALAAAAGRVTAQPPAVALLSNADGDAVRDGQEALDRIVAQVGRPVRWDLCMARLLDLGVTGLVELPPAGALAGLAKRGLPGVEVVAVKTPADLDAARDLAERHRRQGAAA
jgi:[acyl-carrier-protein] S-malonyltransferase